MASAQVPDLTPASVTEPARISRARLLSVHALIALSTVLLVVGMFSVWANRLLFSPDNWSNTSTQLLANPQVRSATANYLIDQLYGNVNVAGLIRSGLPPQLQALAAPAAGALRNTGVQGAEFALMRPRVVSLWAKANRAADQTFIAVVNGGKGSVGIKQGAVTLDLGAILDNVAGRLGLPSSLSARLPANVATLTVFKSDRLKLIQNAGNAIKGLALWLTILVPVLYGLAILLATGRWRRTLMTVGFAGAFAGLLVLFGRSILETQIPNSLTDDATLRPAIRATIAIGTSVLSGIAGACVFVGIGLIAAAWFAGPASLARITREAIAPFLREHPVSTFAITLALLVLLFIWNPIHGTGTPAGIILITVLALLGTELLIRQTMREFPEARPGGLRQAIRARVVSQGRRREQSNVWSAPGATTTAEQLSQLAELRDHGAITPDEYQTAKAQLLHD